jgi:hypothetical protein
VRQRSLPLLLSKFIPAFLILLGFGTPVFGAAPQIIMIRGESLPKPVILIDWNQNQRFLASFVDGEIVKTEDLADRSYLELSLFWGPEWVHYVKSGQSLEGLRSEQANQHTRFYLATETASAAVLVNNVFARKVNGDGIKFLVEKGIPVRHTAPNSSGHFAMPSAGQFLATTLLLAVAGALLMLLWVSRRNLPSIKR